MYLHLKLRRPSPRTTRAGQILLVIVLGYLAAGLAFGELPTGTTTSCTEQNDTPDPADDLLCWHVPPAVPGVAADPTHVAVIAFNECHPVANSYSCTGRVLGEVVNLVAGQGESLAQWVEIGRLQLHPASTWTGGELPLQLCLQALRRATTGEVLAAGALVCRQWQPCAWWTGELVEVRSCGTETCTTCGEWTACPGAGSGAQCCTWWRPVPGCVPDTCAPPLDAGPSRPWPAVACDKVAP